MTELRSNMRWRRTRKPLARAGCARIGLTRTFACGALVVTLAVGLPLGFFLRNQIQDREERFASFHWKFVADSILSQYLESADLLRPVQDARLQRLRTLIENEVLTEGVYRVTIVNGDGVAVFSSDRARLGERQPLAGSMVEALRGRLVSRPDPRDVLHTFAPLKVAGGPTAVLHAEQDFSPIRAAANRSAASASGSLIAAFAVLYAALFPVFRRATKQLRERHDRLEELHRRQSDFIATTSHELRTPLTSIKGYVRTLQDRDGLLSAGQRTEFLRVVDRQTDHLHALIEQLLVAARIESGDPLPCCDVIELRGLLDEVRVTFPARENVSVESDPLNASVVSSRETIHRILTELVANAVKYSPEDSPIRLMARREDGQLVLSVSDSGPGVTAQNVPRMFERFAQLDQSATRTVGGFGLGLYIVDSLVRRLGGNVSVESSLGRGTTFHVRIPVADPAPDVRTESPSIPSVRV